MSRYVLAILGLLICLTPSSGGVEAVNQSDDKGKSEVPASAIEHLKSVSFLYGLTEVATKELVSETCYGELRLARDEFLQKRVWALKMFDSSGSHEPGFMFGNSLWLGDRELCDVLNHNASINVNKELPNGAILTDEAPFDVAFYVAFLEHNSTLQVYLEFALSNTYLHVGLCLPHSCAARDVKSLMRAYTASDYFKSVYGDVYGIQGNVTYVKNLELGDKFYNSTALLLLKWAFGFSAVMIVLTLIVRLLESEVQSGEVVEENELKDFVKCFDLKDNWKKLFTINEGKKNEFALIDGMRATAMIMVVVFHTLYLPETTIMNKVYHYVFTENMSSGVIFVDNFFLMSSFLGAFNFLRNRKLCEKIKQNNLEQNIKEFLSQLFHRLLRLVPAYFVMLVSMDVVYLYLADTSVFHIMDRYHFGCSKYWWHNALFIQNFYDPEEMCSLWTWSLAIEMQYFLFTQLLLFVYQKNPRFVKILVPSLILGNIVWTEHTAGYYDCSSNIALITSYFALIYSNPALRILPYLIGSIAGWYAVEVQPDFKIPSFVQHIIWPGALLVYVASAWGFLVDFQIIWCTAATAILGRVAFAVSVCWMMTASRGGQGGWWSRLFEFNIYQYLTCVSYGIYLFHGIVINLFFGLSTTSMRLEKFSFYIWISGIFALTYILGTISCLLFELPFRNWSSLIQKRTKQKTQ